MKAQFWSVYIPSEHPDPARTVTEQIDLVRRMVERYHSVFEMAYTADDVEQITRKGKIASLIGIEGGVAIENSLCSFVPSTVRPLYDVDAQQQPRLGRCRRRHPQARRFRPRLANESSRK